MNLIDKIVKKYKEDGIRGVLYGAMLKICLIYWITIFNGKDLDVVQGKIQQAIKKRRDAYFLDEVDARTLADNWNGVISKPQDLRFIDGAIPVVLSAGEKLAPVMAVALQSLLNNSNSERKYHFIILNEDFSEKTKALLRDQVSHFSHCVIDFVNVAHVFDEIPISPPPNSPYNIYTWLKLFIPYWFDTYEKVIFLDTDIMAKGDIAELYDFDISDFGLGAAVNQYPEWMLQQKNYSYFLNVGDQVFTLFDNWSRYICTGVLVFDTHKFKMKFAQQDFFKLAIYYSNRYLLYLSELDLLAILLKDDYYLLPPEWNHQMGSFAYHGYYMPSPPNTKIVHYKPWENNPLMNEDPDVLEWRELVATVPLAIVRK